jgi:hypothetical protein
MTHRRKSYEAFISVFVPMSVRLHISAVNLGAPINLPRFGWAVASPSGEQLHKKPRNAE